MRMLPETEKTLSLAVPVAGIASNCLAITASYGSFPLPILLWLCQNCSVVVSVTGIDRYCSSSWRVSAAISGETSAVLFCNLTENQALHLT